MRVSAGNRRPRCCNPCALLSFVCALFRSSGRARRSAPRLEGQPHEELRTAQPKTKAEGREQSQSRGVGREEIGKVRFSFFLFFCPEIRRSAVGSRAALPLPSSTQPPSHCPAANGARERPEVKGLGEVDFGTRSSGRSPPCVRGPFGCAVLSAAGDVQLRSPS